MRRPSRAPWLLALCLLLPAAGAAAAPHWGDFKRDACKANVLNVRQYSAILWDIPFGQSWEAACAGMPATVKGQSFAAPTRCRNAGGHMWGEFDVQDPKDCPNFTPPKDDGCQARESYSGKFRKYSSQMFDVPDGIDPLDACRRSNVEVGGALIRPGNCTSPKPTALANSARELSFHYWAEFFVEDAACGPPPRPFQAQLGLPPGATASPQTNQPAAAQPAAAQPAATPKPAPAASPAAPPAPAPPAASTSAPAAPAPGCDEAKVRQCKALLQDQVPWSGKAHDDPSFRHWQEGNLQRLCNCTSDAAKTVQCFQNELYRNGDSWAKAIDSCAKP